MLCWAGSTLWLSQSVDFGYPMYPALALVLLALALLSRCLEQPAGRDRQSRWLLALAGAALGAAALFRHDFASYGALASVPLLGALAWPGAARVDATESVWSQRVLRLWPFGAGLLVSFGIPAIWLASLVPMDRVVFELFTFPATTYAAVRQLPYPPLWPRMLPARALANPVEWVRMAVYLPFYAPLVFATAALGWLGLLKLVRGKEGVHPRRGPVLAASALLCLAALNTARVRPDAIHVVAPIVVSLVVAVALIRCSWSRHDWASRALAIALSVLAGVVMVVPMVALPWPSLSSLPSLLAEQPDPARVSGLDAGPWRREVAEYLRSVVPKGGRIFVGCGRHDRLHGSEPILYFLADRLPGGRYHSLDPGVATTLAVQEEIVRGLAFHQVDYVVISTSFDRVVEPNRSAVSSGVTRLDDYLRRNYEPIRRFGPHLSVWQRNTDWELHREE